MTLSHRLNDIQQLQPLLLLGHLHLIPDDVCSLHVDELKPLYYRHVVPLFHECSQERDTVEI